MKMRFISLSLVVFSIISGLEGAQKEKQDLHLVYVPGFAEPGGKQSFSGWGGDAFVNSYGLKNIISQSSPKFPDALTNVFKASFYTKQAVHILANHLYDNILNKKACLVGNSRGGGTIITCLAQLIDYENNKDYFKGSKIQKKSHATAILAAINKGALVLKVPLLDVRNTLYAEYPSKIIGAGLTFAAVVTAYFYLALFVEDKIAVCMPKMILPYVVAVSFAGSGFLSHYLFSRSMNKAVSAALVTIILPIITCGNFNPFHQTPLQAIDLLKGKITCPVMLQYSSNDEILGDQTQGMKKLFEALSENNEDRVTLIKTNDGHDGYSQEFDDAMEVFNTSYFPNN